MSQPLFRRTPRAQLCLVLAAKCTACTTLQRTELAPNSATTAGAEEIAGSAPMSEARILMRDGRVMTLHRVRLTLRSDTLLAVVMNGDTGAPANAVSVPMAEVAEVQTPRRSWDRSLGLFIGGVTVVLILVPF